MPVSMSVAEFDEGGNRKKDYSLQSGKDAINGLGPSKPVWIVIHGMNSNQDKGVNMIANELWQSRYISGQVVTVNWEEAAKSYTTQDAPWTKSVGGWVTQQLVHAGFSPSQINAVGHSHGTYVAYAMANEIIEMTDGKEQINTIVALDPANNVPHISGFRVGEMKFSNVSRNSIGIEGSLIAGSDDLVTTTDSAYKIDSSNTEPYQIFTEHSLPIYTFANLLKAGRIASETVPKNLLLSEIMASAEMQKLVIQTDTVGSYEGIISVTTKESSDASGRTFTEAIPIHVSQTISGETQKKIWDILCLQ